ncbi:retrovirus-related pol polyprotein from transposon TNT 1-94 [Tanacetum coccineum]
MALGYQNPFYLKQAQQKQQSLYNGKVVLEKHNPPAVYDSEETLQLAQESRLKMKQLNKEIKPANYTKINYLSGGFVSQTAKSREELYFNTSKTANVSKPFSIPNEEFSDETTPSAAQKFLNEEIERLLRAVVSQDIMSIVQSNSVVDTSNLQIELERTKERFENCIIKKENEYAKLWNDWYKKCEECKYDKISYDKAYNGMQQKIERLQAQLGDLKGKCADTSCVSDTLDPLSQKLENENVQLEFQVQNYEKENAHLKTTYKNLFDSILVKHDQTKTIIESLQDKLHDTIYENAKLRAQLFDNVSEEKDTTKGTSVNTRFHKQSILGKPPSSFGSKLYVVTPFPKSKGLPKIDETHALINPFKPSREEKYVPNKLRASVRINPITVSHSHVITKKDVNSDSNGLSSTGVGNTAKTRRPQPRSNTKNDRVPSASKSSCSKNKEVEVEEHPRNLLLSKNKKHMSSECNNIKLAIRNDKSEVVCAMYSGCSKQMTGNLKLLINFVWKLLGTVRFGNDHVAAILDLEVAFRRNTCFVRNLEGVYLLKGNHTTNLYTINLHEMAYASPICLMAHATSTKSWLWHQCLSYLNFDAINDLARNDLVTGLPKFKYHEEHFCPSCEQGKSKRTSHPPKPVPNSKQRLHLLHMDLCGPMRITNINVKRLKRLLLRATLKTAPSFTVDLTKHHTSLLTGENRISPFFMYLGLFVIPRMIVKTLGNLVQSDIGFFIGHSANSCAYRVYNRRTKKIMETMNVTFNELLAMAFEPSSSKPGLQGMTSGQISSGLHLTYAPSTITTQKPTEHKLDLLFEAMYDDYISGQPSATPRTISATQSPQVLQTPTTSTSIADTTPTPTNSSSQAKNIPNTSQDVDELETQQQHAQQQENQALL